MAQNTVTNWFGNIVSHPQVVIDANSVDDVIAIVKGVIGLRWTSFAGPLKRPDA